MKKILEKLKKIKKLQKFFKDQKIKKTIFVPNRLINIII